MPDNDPRDELLRDFDAAISGMGLDNLRQVSDGIWPTGAGHTRLPVRPDLRSRRRRRRVVLRVRVSLDDSGGQIWRRLDLRSDLTLDTVHFIIQATFGWASHHRFRFSIGGAPDDWTSQVFVCPADAQDREPDDVDAPVVTEVRLDETLRRPGAELHYLYDYGDRWAVTVRLEHVLQAARDRWLPLAVAISGAGAAPPEDSGGARALADMADVVPDPDRFDLDEVSAALRAPHLTLRELGVNPRLVDLIGKIYREPIGNELLDRLLQILDEDDPPQVETFIGSLTAHQWFLDRAAREPIRLTPAGYLRREDAEAASQVLPTMRDWPADVSGENYARPLLGFRTSLQATGLLRKHHGTLLLTRAGAEAQRDPRVLWRHLAERLVRPDRFEVLTEAKLVLLLFASTCGGDQLPVESIGEALAALGWVDQDGTPVGADLVHDLAALDTLVNIAPPPPSGHSHTWISPAAAALARAALLSAP